MGDESQQETSTRGRLPPPPRPSNRRGALFSDQEKAILQSSWEDFRETIEIVGIKHSERLDIFGHEDTEAIFAVSAGPIRNTAEGRAERDGWLPREAFQGKDVLVFGGKGNVAFSLVKWGAGTVTVAETDPVIRTWQRAKMFYGGAREVRSIFSSRSFPYESKQEDLDYLRPILQRVLDDAPSEPFDNFEAMHLIDRDLFDSEGPDRRYEFLIVHDTLGVPGGLSTEAEFARALQNLLHYRADHGSILIYPADYAEDLTDYSGDSFFPWLQDQDLAAHGLELVPPDQFHKVVLDRIIFLPGVLKGRFLLIRSA